MSALLQLRMASIKQYRGKTWRAIIRRVGHPSQSKTFATKREAEAWASAIEARMGVSKYDALQLKQAAVTTVRDVFEQYEAEVAEKMKGRNEAATVRRLIANSTFMRLRLDRVTPEHIRDWRDARVLQITPASVHREMNTISAVFQHAIKEWSAPLTANPAHLVSRFPNADKARNKRWNAADTATFLKACNWKESEKPKIGKDYVGWALLLAIETAMRIGELCLLKVGDFHPEGKYAHLNNTKNGDERNVPLSKTAIRYFAHLCADRKPEEKIFPINANTLGEYVLTVREKCGLKHLLFHDSRHEAATRLSKKLANVLELSAVTGHRSLKSLKRYYHPEPADLAAKLD